MDRREFFARTGVGLASSVLPDIAGLLRVEKEPEPVTNLVPPGRACELLVSFDSDQVVGPINYSSGLKSYVLDGTKPSELARKALSRTGLGLVFANDPEHEGRCNRILTYRDCVVSMWFYEDWVLKDQVLIRSFNPSEHEPYLHHPGTADKIWFALSVITYDALNAPQKIGQDAISRYIAKQHWSDRLRGIGVQV